MTFSESESSSSYEIFYWAAEGATNELERAMKKDKNWISERDERGRNALMHAAIADNIKNFQLLLKKDCSLWERDDNGATALHWATQCASVKVIRHILQCGKEPKSGMAPHLVTDGDGVTPLHIAATRPSSRLLKIFLEIAGSEEQLGKACDKNGRTALHYAAMRVSTECVKLILDEQHEHFQVDHADARGLTPLMCAAGVLLPQAVDICRLLGKRKMVSVSKRNKDGLTALHIAVAANNFDVVKLIVTELGGQVQNVDADNRTPLHYAAEHGHEKIVTFLMDNGARNSTTDTYGVTPAHYAAQSSAKCMEIILAKSQIRDVKDNEKRSCLMWAVIAGNIEAVLSLISNTTPDRQDRDIRGYTALHLAAMTGNEAMCKFLVRQGWGLTEKDKSDTPPLHLAAGRGYIEIIRLFMTHGAAISEKDAMMRTAVFWACFGGHSHTLNRMIKELGFEWRTFDKLQRRVPITDSMGRTLLHVAAFSGYSACIRGLLDIEAEDDCLIAPLVGWRDRDRETALHVACSRGKMDCVLALLKGGAAPNAVDSRSRTPLQCAIEGRHAHVVEHLRSVDAMTYDELTTVAAKLIQRWWLRKREKLEKASKV